MLRGVFLICCLVIVVVSFFLKLIRVWYVFLVDGFNMGFVLRKCCVLVGIWFELEGSRYFEGCCDELDVSRVWIGSVCWVVICD